MEKKVEDSIGFRALNVVCQESELRIEAGLLMLVVCKYHHRKLCAIRNVQLAKLNGLCPRKGRVSVSTLWWMTADYPFQCRSSSKQ